MIKDVEKYIFDCYIKLKAFYGSQLRVGVIYFHEDDISGMNWSLYQIENDKDRVLNKILHALYDEIIIDLIVDKMIENKKEELNEQKID